MQKVLAIVGPTAIGKTQLAITLAQKVNGAIISGDSMQVYREVAVGTAKATPEEQQLVKHYLVDTRSVFEPYSVVDFINQAEAAVKVITKSGKLPMLVGGTGFYVNAFLNQMQLGGKDDQAQAVDNEWQQFLTLNGPEKLWRELSQRDQVAAKKIPPTNTRRVLRALTVIHRTGHKFSKQQEKIIPRYDYLMIGLNSDRSEIYRRINARVDQMMQDGLLNEAKFIYQNREREYQILQAIGYKEFFPYFAGKSTLEDCVEKVKTASRRYAKRQLTYFKNQLPIIWFDPLNDSQCFFKIEQKVKEWLNE